MDWRDLEMSNYQLSACVFIRNNIEGGFCLFESMYQLLPFATEFVVMDLGSTDGTFEILMDIANANPRVTLYKSTWPTYGDDNKVDAAAFADLANDLITMCSHDNVLYYQADEIWHDDLLERMKGEFEQGNFDLSFWRIQYRDNFQRVKWFPHLVHRVGQKSNFNFVGDGMNTDRVNDARLCSAYDGGYFMQWGAMGQEGIRPYVNDMIMDVSAVGGFRDNIIDKRKLHAPFWHESNDIEAKYNPSEWIEQAKSDPIWLRGNSPYNLPAIMRDHVGKVRYEVRDWLIEKLKVL